MILSINRNKYLFYNYAKLLITLQNAINKSIKCGFLVNLGENQKCIDSKLLSEVPWLTNLNTFIIWHTLCRILYRSKHIWATVMSHFGQTLPESHGRFSLRATKTKSFESFRIVRHQHLMSPTSRTQESEDLRRRTKPVVNGFVFPVSHPFDFLYIHLHNPHDLVSQIWRLIHLFV